MSAHDQLFETVLIISPDERVAAGEREELPVHLNVVDPFIASRRQTTTLLGRLSMPNEFGITGFEYQEHDGSRLQKIGGSTLHGFRDKVVGVLNGLHITHDTVPFQIGENETLYSGTWHVAGRARIKQMHIAQELPGQGRWEVLRSYSLYVPSDDFRPDLETERYQRLLGRK